MALEREEEESHHAQNAAFFVLDGLHCDEESVFVEEDLVGIDGDLDFLEKSDGKFPLLPLDVMFLWDDDELLSLVSKENETNPCLCDIILDGFLVSCRKDALDWIFKVKSHYGFTTLTALLAVNYFDRFITSIKFQTGKPWMSQLVAVACLSLAAKVEEIHVPLLLDLQVEEARYIFDAKTIQRMELLVLSTLQWRMHPVTPISYFDHIIRRFSSKCHQKLEFFRKCEHLLISIVADMRFMSYIPSVLAIAIMVYVMKDLKLCDEVEYQTQLMSLLKVNQEKVNECYELLLSEHNLSKKRMMNWVDQDSPSDVFGSWMDSATSEPLLKRRRMEEEQMKLHSINNMFFNVLNSPR